MEHISENKKRAFTQEVVIQHLDDLLPTVIDWIQNNLNPEDVFCKDDLIRWAADEGN